MHPTFTRFNLIPWMKHDCLAAAAEETFARSAAHSNCGGSTPLRPSTDLLAMLPPHDADLQRCRCTRSNRNGCSTQVYCARPAQNLVMAWVLWAVVDVSLNRARSSGCHGSRRSLGLRREPISAAAGSSSKQLHGGSVLEAQQPFNLCFSLAPPSLQSAAGAKAPARRTTPGMCEGTVGCGAINTHEHTPDANTSNPANIVALSKLVILLGCGTGFDD